MSATETTGLGAFIWFGIGILALFGFAILLWLVVWWDDGSDADS